MRVAPRLCSLFFVTAVASGCLSRATRPVEQAAVPPPPQSSAVLAELAAEYWELTLRHDPVWATYLGDRRFDRELEDLSDESYAAWLGALERLRDRARRLPEGPLSVQEVATREALLALVEGPLRSDVCQQRLWDVNALSGVQEALGELPQMHSVRSPEEGDALVVRYTRAPAQIDQHIANLKAGLEQGYSAARPAVDRVIAQLERMLSDPPDRSSFVTSVVLPEAMAASGREALRGRLVGAVGNQLYPGLRRYLDFLKAEYAPRARSVAGVSANPNGAACYAARARTTTGLELSAEEIHRIGLAEVEKVEAGMREIAQRRIGRPDIAALKAALHADPSYRFDGREALIRYNEALVARALAVMPKVFARLPKRELFVKPIEAFRERDVAAGYYYKGSDDGSRPAYYYLNTYQAAERRKYMTEALAFHEAVPGHHLQIALSQELEGLPDFRRHVNNTTFTEGWAHYAELLADELGLYTDDASRFGMWSDQALRAVRLVVDTGMHALGWDRQRALEYMIAHTGEPPDECAREIDRYIVWPGQALAYKMGQLEFLRLRAEAEKTLGDRFQLARFHEVVLAQGSVPFPAVRRAVEAWLAAERAAR